MRFLKRKVVLAQEKDYLDLSDQEEAETAHKRGGHNPSSKSKKIRGKKKPTEKRSRKRVPGKVLTTEKAKMTKNIVKNYGKAICSFAITDLALPYLEKILKHANFKYQEFIKFANKKKDSIDSIENFKLVFMKAKSDTEKEMEFKNILKKLGEIFIKNFSVNWIFSGKMTYKEAHLKFRFKMLRRIRNPELFTYLKLHPFRKYY